MRKAFWLLLACCLMMTCAAQAAQYGAMVDRAVNIRSEAGEDSVIITQVPKYGEINIQEYGEEWSRITYNKKAGYVPTEYLFALRSYDPAAYPVPGHAQSTGYVVLNEDTWIAGGDFEGTTAPQGAMVCVTGADENGYALPVWRGEMTLPKACGEYVPYVPWKDAVSGDVIGGYTTFYGEQQGKGLAAERESNILRGCELLNGHVVKDDYRFSFNRVCAPYAARNGYKYAPNIGGDGFGYGGGVCQLTTTLYNAVLPLPCRLRDWCIHQYTGVVYVPQFFDAAVGKNDFSFLNQMPYSIRIEASARQGVLTVLIYRE